MKKPKSKNDNHVARIDEAESEQLTGQFADSDNRSPDFSEELSDGGERNKMAKAQLERLKND